MVVDEPAAVGFYEIPYTLTQLTLLRDCIEANKHLDEPLTSALRTFIYSEYNEGNTDILFWLRFAEKIQKDKDFPEKEFSERNVNKTYFIITPSAS